MSFVRFKIVYSRLDDPDVLYDELAALVRRRGEARDRKVAEQTTLGIEAPVVTRRRKR